jgi:DHA1 family bicyclomycin/chloramphenicol resistance-like MFS transporter
MDIFKVGTQTYSWIFAGLSIGFIGASQFNIFLIRRFSNEGIFLTALIGQVLVSAVFALSAYQGWLGVGETITLLFLLLACVGLINPNGAALALAPFSKNAGSASALMGFLQMGAGALASMAVALIGSQALLPIVTIFAITSIAGLAILLIGKKRILAKVEVQNDGTAPVAH